MGGSMSFCGFFVVGGTSVSLRWAGVRDMRRSGLFALVAEVAGGVTWGG
jgi:hypothetical protein